MLIPIDQINGQTFDYVIVGGGTAGLTLAARLTEDPAVNVLVLEAGQANIDDEQLLRAVSYGAHFANPCYAWPHKTTKQERIGGRTTDWARGKGLGGSSAVNMMCYTIPPARDIDDFERLGNPGWNWEELEPYFRRVEGFIEPTDNYKKQTGIDTTGWNVGRDGPLRISFHDRVSELESEIQKTFINAGLAPAKRPLEGDPAGVTFLPITYDRRLHKRSYATNAYYLPHKDRLNYRVAVGAHVNRVLAEQAATGVWVATGVEFTDIATGRSNTALARKEVILCAGTLKTPQVLELSGFGRPDVLQKLGVPVKEALFGVGENLQDHFYVALSWELKEDVPYDTLDVLSNPAVAALHAELHASGEGLHTTGVTGFAWATPTSFLPQDKQHELRKQLRAAIDAVDERANPGLKPQLEITLERFETSPGCEFISNLVMLSGPNPPEPGKRYVSIVATMNHGLSRGSVHCVSADPQQEPDIDARYYEQDVDLALHIEAVKFARKVASTPPMRDFLAREHNPGPEVQTDEQLRDWVKLTMGSTWHTASSCSMLPRALNGVVDPTLRVYGTENLRVVDLSVVPLHFAAHTQATVYAIAEKAADIIKSAAAA